MIMAIAKKSEGEVIAFDRNSVLEEFAGEGLEEVTAEDLAIPFLRVLAQLSPQVNKRDGAYVDGAEAGMIYNTVANEAYDGEKGILVVPCHYNRKFIEWQPRSSGGGFVSSHPIDSNLLKETIKNDRGEDVLFNGNILTNTAQFFVVFVEGEQLHKCCITMSSTQLKKARRWVALQAGFKGKKRDGSTFTQPSFSQMYRLKTAAESNDKGDWFGWDISHERALDLSAEGGELSLLHECRDFKIAVADGRVETKDSAESSSAKSPEEDEVPF